MFGRRKDDGHSAPHDRPRTGASGEPGTHAEPVAHTEAKPRAHDGEHAESSCAQGGCTDTGDCCSSGGGTHEIGGPEETIALIDSLTHERDDFKDKWLRAMAEYQNFQRRAIQNEQEAKRQGVTSVLMSVVPVLDSLDMALANAATKSAETGGANTSGGDAAGSVAMTEGVRAVQQGLLAALGAHGVSVIRPAPGDVFDPNQHSAIVQMPGVLADGTPIEPGRVSQTLQVGYMLSAHGQDRVIRSAKVGVVPGGA